MTFNEANTVEQMILDACQGLGWQFVSGPHLPFQAADVTCEPTALAAGLWGPTIFGIGGIHCISPDASACGSRRRP